MNIDDFLSPTDVLVEDRGLDKNQLLKELSGRAAERLQLSPGHIADAILKREKLGSTGMGGGVAIPHARVRGLEKPFGILVRLSKPIDFDAIDGRPVDIVFMLVSPATPEGDQLNALASIARKLMNKDWVDDLRRAKDGAAIYRAVTARHEESASASPGGTPT